MVPGQDWRPATLDAGFHLVLRLKLHILPSIFSLILQMGKLRSGAGKGPKALAGSYLNPNNPSLRESLRGEAPWPSWVGVNNPADEVGAGGPVCLSALHRVHRAKRSTISPPGPEGTRRPKEMEIFFLLLLFFKYELFPAGRQRDEGHWRPPAAGTQPAS